MDRIQDFDNESPIVTAMMKCVKVRNLARIGNDIGSSHGF